MRGESYRPSMIMSTLMGFRTLSPSPRPQMSCSCRSSRSRSLLQTTPRTGRDLRRRLVLKRQLGEHQHRCLTAPLPNKYRRGSVKDFELLKKRGEEHHHRHRRNSNVVVVNASHGGGDGDDDLIPPENLEFNSPGFRRALREFEFASPAAHSPNCIHPSPRGNPFYSPAGDKQFLGRGSFGNVSLCKYQSHCFALKITNRSAAHNHVGERNLIGIRHMHIVTVFRVTELFDKTFICMEFAGHHNLQYLLDHKPDIDFKTKLSFALQVASGLDHCHKNKIIHGDVKPANIIISPSGECKLGDFGLSIKSGDTKCKAKLTGTAAYAAPEVLQGKDISIASDIYSYGIMLWQIYMNEMPFAGEHPHIIIYKVVSQDTRPKFNQCSSENFNEYIHLAKRSWSKEPCLRPKSTELLNELKLIHRRISQQNR